MLRKYEITGVRGGNGEADVVPLLVMANDEATAVAKAVAVLKGRGRAVEPSKLSAAVYHPRTLERWP